MTTHMLTNIKMGAWLLAFALIFPFVPTVAAGTEPLPWALRDTYRVTYGEYIFSYAGDWGEWKIEHREDGPIVESAQARVLLSDGRSLYPFDAGKGDGGAVRITESDFGAGMSYNVVSPDHDGVRFTQSVSIHRGNPFVLLRVAMTNLGEEPIEVAEINPAMFSVSGLGLQTTHGMRHMRARGPYLAPELGVAPFLAVFTDPEKDFTLSVGTLPMGQSDSTTEVNFYDGDWQVTARNVLSPPVRLHPGETIESDPVWVTYSIPRPSDIDLYYSYAQSQLPRPESSVRAPKAWISVPAGSNADALYRAADAWSGAGVRHALVPALWQDPSGALEGARPAYPRRMSDVASALRGRGMLPGLTVDPLIFDDGNPSWVFTSEDGRHWLNPTEPAARAAAIERMRQFTAWGFEFFAIEPSLAPDDVLRQFNLTRKAADALAFEIMAEAAENHPVLPAATVDMRPDLAAWLNVSGATSRLREYGVLAGPVRFDASGIDRLDDAVLTAMMFYGGPIEFAGSLSSRLSGQVARAIAAPSMAARPLSIEMTPRLWQVHFNENGDAPARGGIVTFPGAPSFDLASHGFEADTTIWKADAGTLLHVSANPLPPSDALVFHSLSSTTNHPTLLGIQEMPDALVQDVRDLQWDATTNTLSGRYPGGIAGSAYVTIPPGWRFESAEINNRRVRIDAQNGFVAFEVSEGTATRFALVFSRG